MSEKLIVDIADVKASNSDDTIVTYALGSCIGLAVFDPVAKAGALLHFMLPDSRLDKVKAVNKPCMFADTGIIKTLQMLKAMGCKSNRVIAKIAGGSNIMDPKGTFNIGKRNYLAVKKILWKFSILIKGEDVGGSLSRNMTLDLQANTISVRHSGETEERLI